ncbi:hypothetical protein CLV92_101283 [Kineococcus xinjiangensis]|uniref:Uncharacterized protein n=1 Tax=Kineococcus xinjiangensis TaxID=512762 RepID=A0A2S6IW53_9ACTN|nr:lipoprotein [Kineococcus xinjiangensis]PPK98584.1 hypothetical protein CLV92_101283 [Kineococcus xinjiangensis]
MLVSASVPHHLRRMQKMRRALLPALALIALSGCNSPSNVPGAQSSSPAPAASAQDPAAEVDSQTATPGTASAPATGVPPQNGPVPPCPPPEADTLPEGATWLCIGPVPAEEAAQAHRDRLARQGITEPPLTPEEATRLHEQRQRDLAAGGDAAQ